MSISRILALGLTLTLAHAFGIVTSDSARAETHWCRMVMAKCFTLERGSWVEVPLKPNQNLGLLGRTGPGAEGSQGITRAAVPAGNRVAASRSHHQNSGNRCFTYNGRTYC